MKTTGNRQKRLPRKPLIKEHNHALPIDSLAFKKFLAGKEEIYKAIFDNSLDAILLTSPDGTIHSANPAACRLFERSEEEICRLGRNGVVDTSDQHLDVALNKRATTGNYFGELILIKRSGEKFHAEITTSIFTSPERGQLTTMIIRDITERKKSERELFQSRERYRLLMENSGFGIGYYGINGKILMFNKEAVKNLGGKASDYIGMNLTEVFGKETGQFFIDRLKLAAESEKPLKFEDNIELDGKPGWYLSTHSRILDQDGIVEGIQVIAENINERKIEEEKLRTSEAEYRSLFDNSIIGISQSQPGGKYIRINKAYAEMYGYPDTNTMLMELSSNIKMLYSNPDDRKRVLEMLDKKGYMKPTEFELNRRNGEKFWALVGAIQVRDDAGNLLYLQAEHIDITSQKKMEEELRKSKELLEKLNQHLVEVRENERNQIALNLHDDLGQKLTAINLDIAWLKSRIGVQSKTVLEKFEEMSSMIKETVESIRETSSLLRPAILFDLGLVSAIKSNLGKFEKQTGIKCHFYFKPEEFDIEDRVALILYRVLQESLTNIARHSGASATEIELVILKNKIEMIIEDNGKGFAKDRVNSLESMGIAGMRERVKSVHGKIAIIGEPGAGTRIKVIIPLTKEKGND
jgi:PAS domain S-box-containing protein